MDSSYLNNCKFEVPSELGFPKQVPVHVLWRERKALPKSKMRGSAHLREVTVFIDYEEKFSSTLGGLVPSTP